MNIIMDPSTSHSRSLSASSAYSGNLLLPPPSNHGVPKSPSALSTRSNRSPPFPGMGLPSSPRPSEPRSPLSPPMSAKSFGTYIDSAPSTPAYSPRMGSTWDNSTLVLLSPVSSVTSSPGEPAWQMMAPIQKPPKRMTRHKVQPSLNKEISLGAALSSWPVTPVTPEIPKESCPPVEEEETEKTEEDQKTQAPPLERLATRMKTLLRRKTVNNKKSSKKQKGYYELDRVETTHWTEL